MVKPPQDIFNSNLFNLCKVIESDVLCVSLSCVSHGIITRSTHKYILDVTGVTNEIKANKLIVDIQNQLESRKNDIHAQRYHLLQVFKAFLNVKNPGLTRVVEQMKLEL